MEKLSTIAYGVVALVVVVILIFTVALPVVEDSQKVYTIEKNNTAQTYNATTSPSDLDLTIKVIDGAVHVGDYIMSNTDTMANVFLSDNLIVRADGVNTRIYVDDIENNKRNQQVGSAGVVIEGGAVTYQIAGTPYSTTITSDAVYIANEGQLGCFQSGTINFNNDSELYVFMAAGSDLANYEAVIKGSIKDGFTPILSDVRVSGEYYPVSNEEYTLKYTPDSYNLTYSMDYTDKVGISFEYDSTEYNGEILPSVIYAPIKYVTVTENSGSIYLLLGIIPLILAIIPVMLAVQLMTGGRRD